MPTWRIKRNMAMNYRICFIIAMFERHLPELFCIEKFLLLQTHFSFFTYRFVSG
jgi:hypothetical protein